jgi:hypothetical protein
LAPPVIYEDVSHPRLREVRELIPARIRTMRDPWAQVLSLRTWLAQAWIYEAFGSSYSPWDPATVLAWTKGNWGHGRARPIAMCVHYGITFTSLAAALGHRSRGLVITESVNGPCGHFMSEIWDKARGKWVTHDPNFDLHYEDERGVPLSGVELADRARTRRVKSVKGTVRTVKENVTPKPWTARIHRGPGFTSDCPRLNGLLNDKLATGDSFAVVGVWRLNNVIAEPASAPPNHGSVVYGETDFIWYAPGGDISGTEMFPHHVSDRAFFEAPPPRTRATQKGARR